MRNETEPLLRDELSSNAAHTVSLVLDSDQRSLKILDKLVLTLCKSTSFLLCKFCSTLLHNLESWRCILDVIA